MGLGMAAAGQQQRIKALPTLKQFHLSAARRSRRR